MNSIFERKIVDVVVTVKYPWLTMNVGEEFVFPENIRLRDARMKARSASRRAGAIFQVTRVKGRIHCKKIRDDVVHDGVSGRPALYPWRTMRVGESFTFETDNLLSCKSFASKMSSELGKRFKVMDGKVITCRRIK